MSDLNLRTFVKNCRLILWLSLILFQFFQTEESTIKRTFSFCPNFRTHNWIFFLTNGVFFTLVVKHFYFISSLGDSVVRFYSEDAPLNNFSFFWTNFWYIPSFFSLLLFLGLINSSLFLKVLFTLCFFYVYEMLDLSSNNWVICNYTNLTPLFNNLLTNNLNKYHPFIFYMSVIFLFKMLIEKRMLFITKHKNWIVEESTFHTWKLILFALQLIFLALFLGSWWALQEGTWGGWWNWDASETFGLLLMLVFIRWFHVFKMSNLVYSFNFSIRFFFFCFLAIYFLMQLNFDLISHNFGIKFFFFFNNSIFLIEMFIFFVYLFAKEINHYFFYFSVLKYIKIQSRQVRKKPKVFIMYTLFQLLIWWILCVSFGPVLNYFFWAYFNLNLFNTFGVETVSKLSISLTILFYFFLIKIDIFLICILFFLLTSTNFFFFLALILKWSSTSVKIHGPILLFTIINAQISSSSLSYSFLKSSFLLLHQLDCPFWISHITYILNTVSYFNLLNTFPFNSYCFVNENFLSSVLILPLFGFFLKFSNILSLIFNQAENSAFLYLIEIPSMGFYLSCVFLGLSWTNRIFFKVSKIYVS